MKELIFQNNLMLQKVFGWIMMGVNVIMLAAALLTPASTQVMAIFIFFGEVFITAKYIQGLTKKQRDSNIQVELVASKYKRRLLGTVPDQHRNSFQETFFL